MISPMRSLIACGRLIWTVLLAVCFATVAPSVSAMLEAGQTSWVEVCTATGAELRPVVNPSGSDAPTHTGNAHCLYCLLNQDLAAPPQPGLFLQSLPIPQERLLRPVLALPYQAVAWRHHPSRAPPALT
jgi:Protein of unknown function (DUF2946)